MPDSKAYHQVKVQTLEKFLDHADTMLLHAAGNLAHYVSKFEPKDWDESPVSTLCDLYSCARQLKELITQKIIAPTTDEVKNAQPGCIAFDNMELTLVNTTIMALEQYKYDLKEKYKISFEVH